MKKIVFLCLVVFVLVMMGCASSDSNVIAFRDQSISDSQHGVLITFPGIVGLSVDGRSTLAFVTSTASYHYFLVPSGVHDFSVSYDSVLLGGRGTTDSVTLGGAVLPGQYYGIRGVVEGQNVRFTFFEVTDPSLIAKADKEINKAVNSSAAQRAENKHNSLIEAENAAPTQLEGTWLGKAQDESTFEYTFTGQLWTLKWKPHNIDAQYSRGTFELRNGKMVRSTLQYIKPGYEEWMDYPLKIKETIGFSFSPEGHLLLNLTGGFGTVTFIKQEDD